MPVSVIKKNPQTTAYQTEDEDDQDEEEHQDGGEVPGHRDGEQWDSLI